MKNRLTNHPAKDIKEENMRISYYNLDKDDFNKKHSRFKKKKLFTIWFHHILEMIQFENSDRVIYCGLILKRLLEYSDFGNKVVAVEVRNSIRLGLTTIVAAVNRVTIKRREYERI